MKRHDKAELALLVWGDWYSVIGVRDYRDALIDQKPCDEDGGEYAMYVIPCANTDDLVKAYEAFKQFRRAFRLNVGRPGSEWRLSACTADGYSNDGPFVALEVDDSVLSGKVAEAAKKAAELLREALK